MEVLKLENLSKYYTSENSVVMGLTGINLSFSLGEFVALTGESGSGKSTLAHVLGGILPYESGELYIYGKPTSHYDSQDWEKYRRDLVSFISQSYGILQGNTVLENIESALYFSGICKEEVELRAKEILHEVELDGFEKRKAAKLSSGQKQRLSIARALAKPSKILIADEPTGNLDRENSEKVIRLLKKASRERLVILITHEFEEARDFATRRIILSDGVVVTDAKLSPKEDPAISDVRERAEKKASGSEKKKKLVPYVTYLTLKSRPIFSGVLCLLLAVTTFITFVFLGTFVMSVDDSSTKKYDRSAFYNGDPRRIVVMRPEGSDFLSEDYDEILSKRYVEYIDRYGYINDFSYHYVEGEDYRVYNTIVAGPNYDAVTNPDDWSMQEFVELFNTDKFIKSIPHGIDIVKDGRAPENFYEVVSADASYNIGDTVNVYIRNLGDWSESSHIGLRVKVVGTTNQGEGLYFSDKMAAALINPVQTSAASYIIKSFSVPVRSEACICFPYEEGAFVQSESIPDDFVLGDNEFLVSEEQNRYMFEGGTLTVEHADGTESSVLKCKGYVKTVYSSVIVVSEEMFYKLVDNSSSDQISVYIDDYAYTERVTDALNDEGYIAISPFKLGSTNVIPELAEERIITLVVCFAVLLISFILQVILLRAMFNSMNEYFKLMSDIGLTAKTAILSVSGMLILLTLMGELISGGIVTLLSALGVERIYNIFKYLDVKNLILLFSVHFLTVMLSLFGIISGLFKNVFGKTKKSYDIEFEMIEEDAV